MSTEQAGPHVPSPFCTPRYVLHSTHSIVPETLSRVPFHRPPLFRTAPEGPYLINRRRIHDPPRRLSLAAQGPHANEPLASDPICSRCPPRPHPRLLFSPQRILSFAVSSRRRGRPHLEREGVRCIRGGRVERPAPPFDDTSAPRIPRRQERSRKTPRKVLITHKVCGW